MDSRIYEFHFLQELFSDLLSQAGVEYNPVAVEINTLRLPNWYYIVLSIKTICEKIDERNHLHMEAVIHFVRLNDRCHIYMDKVGRNLFAINFSWSTFRILLAHISVLHLLSYKRGWLLVADNFLITATTYIENNLRDKIQELGGWESFYRNCVRSAMRLQPSDSPRGELMPAHEMDALGTYYVISASKRALEQVSETGV